MRRELQIARPDEVDGALEQLFAHDGPGLVDCRVAPEECVYPMVAPGGSIDEMLGGVPGGPLSARGSAPTCRGYCSGPDRVFSTDSERRCPQGDRRSFLGPVLTSGRVLGHDLAHYRQRSSQIEIQTGNFCRMDRPALFANLPIPWDNQYNLGCGIYLAFIVTLVPAGSRKTLDTPCPARLKVNLLRPGIFPTGRG